MLVREDRVGNQRHANRVGQSIKEDAFDGNRYAFEIDVEKLQAIQNYEDDLREVFVTASPSIERTYSTPSHDPERRNLRAITASRLRAAVLDHLEVLVEYERQLLVADSHSYPYAKGIVVSDALLGIECPRYPPRRNLAIVDTGVV